MSEEIIKKANLIIENHREVDKMMIIEIVDLVQGLLDLYEKEKLNSFSLSDKLNKEKEKNKKIEEKIKKAIKEIERRMNLANECIEQEIVIADSDSLNYGRAQAHDVDSVLLKEILE